MLRVTALLLFLASACRAAEPRITFEEIAPPAAAALGGSLSVAPDGTAWLSWPETSGGLTSLHWASYDPAARKWTAARTIARGVSWSVNQADPPSLTLGTEGRATAVWSVNNPATPAGAAHRHEADGPGYRAFFSQTTDAGRTWSTPAPLTSESDSVEFVSLATLADGRVLATWLDGRARRAGRGQTQLFARLIGDVPGARDTLVDASVCDCCPTTLTAFPDGSALLAYRGRSPDEVRDIRVSRFRDGHWADPRTINNDEWRLNACPVNGPQITSDGGRVAAVWFTAAENDPRVLASLSSDAGARFLLPLRISETKPAGRASVVLLHDSAFIVTWVDAAGALWLRRISPDFVVTDPITLSLPGQGKVRGFPRAVLVRDYQGGREPAQFVVVFTGEQEPALHTLLVTVPEGDLLEAEKNCDCAPTSDQLRGFSMRGTILSVDATAEKMRVQHLEVPGIFPAGTRDFRVPPVVLAGAAPPGRQFFGRVEQRAGVWWLFDVRLIAGLAR